jgi:hypothetical protein
MVKMVLHLSAGDQIVVYIREDLWQPVKDVVHMPLKRLSCVFKTKRHKQILKNPMGVRMAVLGTSSGAGGIWL